MDMKLIGQFLAQLRKEKQLTQEQLGEKLGVSNKTVSRWENGNYLPPVEMLQLMSELYGISINEILSGQRLDQQQYRVKAEENIKATLEKSTFTLKEKIDYYERKWHNDHRVELIIECVCVLAGIFLLGWLIEDIGGVIGFAIGLWRCTCRKNEKKRYIEEHAFDGSGNA
jgi:transcriptional regulator with XRE-family HTH domain